MQAATLQKKEKSDSLTSEPAKGKDVATEQNSGTFNESVLPLFMQSMTSLSASPPPQIQRQIIQEEDDEQSEFIQPKLTIGKPGDRYEQEADRMAQAIMQTPESPIQPKPT